ncbi:MAG: 23S rRNA (pseudouridine(1915)-N(3))-methyltransferase RlmH [Gammaproteobacteria bacterium]|nr:23S rRNA (pseudouridine(1915)-N(3))-methyltransferase RlmH [Gammaproteobacteria bacterium]
MKICLHAIGNRMPRWVDEAYQAYAKRLSGECKLLLRESAPAKRTASTSLERILQDEGTRLLDGVPKGAHIVALDVGGQAWSTEQLAETMQGWMRRGQDISLLIGGPDGLSEDCLQRADQRWSLSPLTFPHPLVRVILAEQLYRAFTIIKNHPYHRAG